MKRKRLSVRIPAESVALLLIRLLQDPDGAGAILMSANGQQDIHKTHGYGIGIAQVRLDRGEKTLVGESRDWRNEGVGDADAISAIRVRLP